MRLSPLLVLAVIAVAGCVGSSPARVDINNGVVIGQFTADPTDVFDFQTVTFSADIINVGGTTAEDVRLKLLGVENAWRQQAGTGVVSEVSKGPFSLRPPNSRDNIPGDSRFFDFVLTAPDLNEGDKATFPVKARAEFAYTTTGSVIVKALNLNQQQILQRTGQTVTDAVKESNSDGPVKFSLVRGSAPLVIDPDEDATIERNFRFEISNAGSGWPITDNSVGKVGGSSRGSRISLQAPSGIALKSCDGISGSPGSFSVILRSDGRAPISCTLSISTADWRAKSEGNIVFNVELNYRYFVEDEVSINVQGTKRGDVSRPGPAPVATTTPGTSSSTTIIGTVTGPPLLSSTSPASGAANVPLLTTSVQIIFDRKLDAASIRGAVSVTGSKEGLVAGAASLAEDQKTIIFTPSAGLQPDSTYTVIVSTGVKSEGGSNIADFVRFSFKTTASDTTAPTVKLVLPALDATLTTRTPTISVQTNEASTCRILSTSQTLSTTNNIDHSLTLTLTADGPQTFTIRCRDNSPAGNEAAANDLTIRFTVDATAPTISAKIPEGAGASKTPKISITFGEKMNKVSVAGAFVLKAGATTITVGPPLWSTDELTATFEPAAALAASAEHTATLSTTAKDLAGNPLAETIWKFTTVA